MSSESYFRKLPQRLLFSDKRLSNNNVGVKRPKKTGDGGGWARTWLEVGSSEQAILITFPIILSKGSGTFSGVERL